MNEPSPQGPERETNRSAEVATEYPAYFWVMFIVYQLLLLGLVLTAWLPPALSHFRERYPSVVPYIHKLRSFIRFDTAILIATLLALAFVAYSEYAMRRRRGIREAPYATYNILSTAVLVAAIHYITFYVSPEAHVAMWWYACSLLGSQAVSGLLELVAPDYPLLWSDYSLRGLLPTFAVGICLALMAAIYWNDIWAMFN